MENLENSGKALTLDSLKMIIDLYNEGLSYKEIARKMGRTHFAIATVISHFRRFEEVGFSHTKAEKEIFPKLKGMGVKMREVRSPGTQQATLARYQSNGVKSEQTPQVTQEAAPDRYSRLEKAYATFEEGLQSFITEEVNYQVEAVLLENKTLKEELEQLKEKMVNQETESKKSWIHNLKRSF